MDFMQGLAIGFIIGLAVKRALDYGVDQKSH